MDIHFIKPSAPRISLTNTQLNNKFTQGQSIDVGFDNPSISIEPISSKGPAYKFAMSIISGSGNINRLTYDEWIALENVQGNMWYAVTTNSDELRYLYLGNTLIAKASEDGTRWGFAYSFPIIFGK